MKDFDNFILKHKEFNVKSNFIFRGVNEAKYKLYNSAQRYWITHELKDFNAENYVYFVCNLIHNAKNYLNGILDKYFKSFGYYPNDFSILSFLQHYKAPTPLLDWTKILNYALFFSLDNLEHFQRNDINNYVSIYALDTSPLKEKERTLKESVMKHIPTIENVLSTENIRNSKQIIDSKKNVEYTTNMGGLI